MAALDNDQLVVRVVYTGPPMAGKTQSVRALMPLLKGKGADQAVMSPGEWRGRTAFFDFADYIGGAYEGKPIRCQILSTPGQVALSDRRELLLRAADAVIMVVASQPGALERAMQSYEEMEPWLADAGRDVPIRLILQCNKQDLPDAIPSDEIGRILGLPCGKDVYATSARTGKGLRAAFVAGVRNAVERARALVARGVPLDALEIESGDELFERMRREVAPLGTGQPRAPSAHAPASAKRAASPAAPAPSAERREAQAPRVPAPAASPSPSGRPARSSTRSSQSGLFPSASPKTTAAPGARPSTTTGGKAAGTPASGRTTAPGQKAPLASAATRQKAASGAAPAAAGVAAARSGARHLGPGSAPSRPARSSPDASRSAPGTEPLGSSVPAAASSPAAAPRAGGVPRPKPSEPAPAVGGASSARDLGKPAVSSAPPSGAGRPAPRGSREPAAASRRAPAAGWRPLGEPGPAVPGATRQERADALRPAGASSASAPTGAATEARGAASAALEARVDGVTVRAPATREPAPASSARRAIILPPAEPRGVDDAASLTDATGQRAKGSLDPAGEAARAWRPGSGPRPSVLPASAYHSRLASSPDPSSGVVLHPAANEPIEGPSVRPTQAWFKPRPRRDVESPPAAAPELRPRSPLVVTREQPVRPVAGGARPAVMPAAAYFAALHGAGSSELRSAASTGALDAPLDAGATSPAGVSSAVLELAAASEPARAERSRAASAAARTSDSSVPPTHASRQAALQAAAPRSTRPAVMPASAYLASLEVRDEPAALELAGASDARGRQPLSEGSRSPASSQEATSTRRSRAPASASARPAVMPASAYFATLAHADASTSGHDGIAPQDGAPTAPQPDIAPRDSAAIEPSAAPRLDAPGAATASVTVDIETRDVAATSEASAALAVTAVPNARGRLDATVVPGPASAESSSSPDRGAEVDPELEARRSPLADHRKRPAVMPARAYFAALAAGAVMPTRATPVAHAPAARADRGAPGAALPNRAGAIAAAAGEGESSAGGRAASESLVQRAVPSRRSSRPAVMPARAWRSALLIQPESSSPEWAAPRLTGNGSDGPRESSAPASGDAPEAAASRTKSGATPSLRLVKGGTSERRSDEPRSPTARPALTLLSRPAVMPASAWRDAPPMAAAATTLEPEAGRELRSRPAVMPASAWKRALAAADAEAGSGTPEQPAFHRSASASDAPSELARTDVASWEVAPPDDASWEVDPADAAAPAGPASTVLLPPGVQTAPGHDVPVTTLDRFRFTRASTHGLEFSSSIPVDEPSESFRIPETPPGLQAFVAASRRALFPYPATDPNDDERNEREPGVAASLEAASESPPRNVTLSEGGAGALPSDPTAAPRTNPCAEPGEPRAHHLDTQPESSGERFDSVGAMSLAPTPREDEAPPFSFPGPRLPGQARIPRAVWRRACWRTLETQITAYASALSDARGRWIGELAPGWFARTLRKASDERSARRVFAEQVLRERKLGRYLSRPRCVVLTEETDGFWIWQVACRVPTLATILRPRLGPSESPSEMAGALLDAALGYLDARHRFVEARVPLPLSPHALSFQDGKIVYSGLMPDPGAVFVEPAGNGYAAFQDALRKMWPDATVDAPAVLAELHGKAAGRLPEPLLEIIRSVVGQR
jgi:signal recognition particle receptor subunit beta